MEMSVQSPPLSPTRLLGFALHDVAHLLRTYVDQRASEVGTTRAQWGAMVRLQRSEGMKQSDLARELELQPITVTRLVDRLCAQGMVERRPDAQDRRAKRLYLTAKAVPKLVKLGALSEELMGTALAGISPEEIKETTARLETMRANLKAQLKA
jgi:MarR family transcriptional regulator for hemolysin